MKQLLLTAAGLAVVALALSLPPWEAAATRRALAHLPLLAARSAPVQAGEQVVLARRGPLPAAVARAPVELAPTLALAPTLVLAPTLAQAAHVPRTSRASCRRFRALATFARIASLASISSARTAPASVRSSVGRKPNRVRTRWPSMTA